VILLYYQAGNLVKSLKSNMRANRESELYFAQIGSSGSHPKCTKIMQQCINTNIVAFSLHFNWAEFYSRDINVL
jgi:hypothetical protein